MATLRGALRYLLDLKREATDDDLTGLAAELAFRFFMALFPFVLVLVTLGAFIARLGGVDDPSKYVLDAVGDSLLPMPRASSRARSTRLWMARTSVSSPSASPRRSGLPLAAPAP